MMVIDRTSKIPIYRQIYNDINTHIQDGEYSLGSTLPTEIALCKMYGVQRATIRRALSLLVEDGRIIKKRGYGTSIATTTKTKTSYPERKLTKTLLFLLPKGKQGLDRIDEPFNGKLLDLMEKECALRGYDIIYKSFSQKFDSAEELISFYKPSGAFFISYLSIDMYKQFNACNIPVVLVNQSHPYFPCVCLDDMAGVRMAIDHLYKLGHRKIGFIDGHADDNFETNRFIAYRDYLIINGLEFNPDWVVSGNWMVESGRSALKELVEKNKNNMPTAIFSSNDSMAIGAMVQATDMGFSVPKDISIVGFDNIDQCTYVQPKISTIAFDYNVMTKAACMLMLDMINHNNKELNVIIYAPLSLVVRESTRIIGTDLPKQ